MILALQTNMPGRLRVWLFDRRGRVRQTVQRRVRWHGAEWALRLVDQALRLEKKTIGEVTGLMVVRGPGPFSAVRTGLIIANTISQLNRLPVLGLVRAHELLTQDLATRVGQLGKAQSPIIKPWYGRAPNITRAEKR